jgi:hypothetical protein
MPPIKKRLEKRQEKGNCLNADKEEEKDIFLSVN